MPATAANLFASSATTALSTPPAPKPKDTSSSSNDFSEQLKEAQQTQTQSQPPAKGDTKTVRREVTKATRPTKSKGKTAKPGEEDESAPAETQAKDKTDATASSQPLPEAQDDQGKAPADSNDDAPKRKSEKMQPVADDSSLGTPPLLVSTPPIETVGQPDPHLVQIRNERIARLAGSGTRSIPFQNMPEAKAVASDPTAAKQAGKTAAASDPGADGTEHAAAIPVSSLDGSDGSDAVSPFQVQAPVSAKSATKMAAAQAVAAAVDPVAAFAGDSAASQILPSDSPKITTNDPTDLASMLPVAAHPTPAHTNVTQPATTSDAASPPQEAQFAQANHANIVSDVKTALLPHGGTMRIRLDPPELGALQVNIEVRDGAVNATFQTSNDDATRLLSHSLGQLKTALESQGVTVDKIQVQQSPKNQDARNDTSQQQQQQRDDTQARQNQRDQQRREMLQKMWAKVSGQQMPVDLVA